MSKLKQLFESRDQLITSMLDKIMNEIPNVISACQRFFGNSYGDDATMELEWHNILYSKLENNITLIGVNRFKVGDIILLPGGDTVTVTEDNMEYFKSYLRVSIPFELATMGSEEQIYEFLSDVSTISDVNETSQNTQDFDLDKLTDEQKKALDTFRTSHFGGNEN